MFSYYLLLEHDKIQEKLTLFFPKNSRKMIHNMFQKVEVKLGAWLRGQLLLMLIVGLISLVGLNLLQINFSVSLAIIAGILEIIPIVGPIIATIPAVLVGVTQSGWHAVAVIILYIFIQQLEQSLFVPRVMKSAVGLDPLVVILAIMIGGRLGGTLGALLAIPVTVVLLILWKEYQAASAGHPTSKE
jgi:predicted PurR-regulated permease PerM